MLVMCVAGCVGRRVNNTGIGKLICTDAGHSYYFHCMEKVACITKELGAQAGP